MDTKQYPKKHLQYLFTPDLFQDMWLLTELIIYFDWNMTAIRESNNGHKSTQNKWKQSQMSKCHPMILTHKPCYLLINMIRREICFPPIMRQQTAVNEWGLIYCTPTHFTTRSLSSQTHGHTLTQTFAAALLERWRKISYLYVRTGRSENEFRHQS